MKKLFCIGLILCMVLAMSACGIIEQIQNQVDNLGNGFNISLDSEKLQELLQQGMGDLQGLFGQSIIESAGELTNNKIHEMHVYDDKIILNLSTNDVINKMQDEGVTLEKIREERADAETAKMEYILQYQFCVQFKVNGESKAAVGVVTATEDTLNDTMELTIPITSEKIGVTIYDLLQGGHIIVERCLQHGTATTKVCSTTYFLNKLLSEKEGTILTLVDHREG